MSISQADDVTTTRSESTQSPVSILTSDLLTPMSGLGSPYIERNQVLPTRSMGPASTSEEDAIQAHMERLSPRRPPAFRSAANEILFVLSISLSQFLTEFFVSGFTLILPTVIHELDIPLSTSIWPATSFSLAIATTLLFFGRVADIYGCSIVFLAGLVWMTIWSIIAGFSTNDLMLDCCRALQGLGAAVFLPAGVGLLGQHYRPGRRKNLVFAIYGTSAVFGFFGGIFVGGIVGQFLRWGWYFWIGAIVSSLNIGVALWSVPKDKPEQDMNVKMDWLGAAAITIGLVLTVFAITQSAHAPHGWRTPYIPVCLILGIVSLLIAAWIETTLAEQPLLPASVFTSESSMTPLLLALFFLYGTWGIFSVYGTLYFQNIMGASPLQVVAWYVPLGVAGLLFSIFEGFILHIVPGKVLLIIAGLAAVASQLLIALIPQEGWSYWAWILPATIFSTIGIDLPTIQMTVYVTTVLPASQQGLAGGLINSVLQLGVALVLGLADVVQSATIDEAGLAVSYKHTFQLGIGMAAISLLLMVVWGNVPKATSVLTATEKEELREAALEDRRNVCETIK